MTGDTYDFIVIGGGSAGYAAAGTASKLGLRTAVIEGGTSVGGLCILRGCMPSKTLLESGHRALAIREAAEFGLKATFEGANGPAIRERKRRLIAEFASYRRTQLETGRFEFVRGVASFADPHTIDVRLSHGGERRLNGRTFLIATGSEISGPKIEGLAELGFWTSDDALDAETIPESVCILGGGAIALEFASYYAGLGVATTVIQRSPHILKEMDEDVTDALTAALEKRRITVFRGTHLQRASRGGTGKRVHFEHAGALAVVEAEQIIYALGRAPALRGLALERTGLSTSCAGLAVKPTQQSDAPHIFAAGDGCGPHQVVHLAIQQGEVAARNAARVLGRLKDELEEMDYRLNLFACFTHPEVASVGLTERDCATQMRDVVVARYAFAEHGKALIRGVTDGFVKLIADRMTRELVGGSCVGPEASELIHEITVAMRFHATAHDLATTPHYHPTLSEIWTYPAEELAGL